MSLTFTEGLESPRAMNVRRMLPAHAAIVCCIHAAAALAQPAQPSQLAEPHTLQSAQTAPPAQPVTNPAPATPLAPEHVGILKSVRGDVRLVDASGTVREAVPGDRVKLSEQIVSGADGAAGLVLRDGTALVIGPLSRFELKQFAFDATTRDGNMFVSLLRGSLRMVSGLIGKTKPDAVRIDTQTATIGIRGTDFIVTADGQP